MHACEVICLTCVHFIFVYICLLNSARAFTLNCFIDGTINKSICRLTARLGMRLNTFLIPLRNAELNLFQFLLLMLSIRSELRF